MRRAFSLALGLALVAGCASNVRFIKTADEFEPGPKPDEEPVNLRVADAIRPYEVVGVIEAKLGGRARRADLDALLIKKAREIGVDAVIFVEYGIDRDAYIERHGHVIGRGPWRHRVVTGRPRVTVEKTATGLAVLYK